MTQSRPNIVGSTEFITPELAAHYLELNIDRNRRINQRRVKAYAQQMKDGEWQPSTICFDTDGRLFDGQHRMSAVVESGVGAVFFVSRGWTPKSREYIDLGQKRNAVNIATMQGLDATTKHLAVARAMLIARFGAARNTAIATHHQTVGIYRHYKESIDFAMTPNANSVAHASIRAVVARAHIYGVDSVRLAEFNQVLCTGFPCSPNPTEDSAAIALRNHYIAHREERSDGGNGSRTTLFYRAQGALLHFLNRKDIRSARVNSKKMWKIPELDEGELSLFGKIGDSEIDN